MACTRAGVYTLIVNQARTLFKTIGSAWLAAVLLLLVLVAMACATAYESTHGTALALLMFYKSWWFEGLLLLLALNVLAAVLARLPLDRARAGPVITHLAILVILVGAWVTKCFGIDGQVEIREGQTVRAFALQQDALTLEESGGHAHTTAELDPVVFNRSRAVADPALAPLVLGNLRVQIEAYAPDSTEHREVVNDSQQPQPALEITLGAEQEKLTGWVFADQPSEMNSFGLVARRIADAAEFARLLAPPPASRPASNGTVRVEVGEKRYEYPLERCTDQPIVVGDTGFSIQVLRYLPHAVVGADRQLRSVSDQPVNPAIEVEVSGAEGSSRRLAFARFPDFPSMHGTSAAERLKLTFVASADTVPKMPMEVLIGPSNELAVRLTDRHGQVTIAEAAPGKPVKTPFAGMTFEIGRFLDHARVRQEVGPLNAAGEDPTPALKLAVTTPAGTNRFWLRKFDARPIDVAGTSYLLQYANRTLPLGFSLRLDQFRMDKYPGTERPRSFQSHVTFLDPASGREQGEVISMNNPACHGSYTLFQSSYRLAEGGPSSSVLSVSWDPGQPIVFFGYVAMLSGMLWVVVARALDRRRTAVVQ
ncbi:MAG TPA: cytochrome c biogenesis protein ResB [Phycisphaerae bacterium]|nr:cytochrome c biogenesis protein ResB [Phycisphaerae bacterium]